MGLWLLLADCGPLQPVTVCKIAGRLFHLISSGHKSKTGPTTGFMISDRKATPFPEKILLPQSPCLWISGFGSCMANQLTIIFFDPHNQSHPPTSILIGSESVEIPYLKMGKWVENDSILPRKMHHPSPTLPRGPHHCSWGFSSETFDLNLVSHWFLNN